MLSLVLLGQMEMLKKVNGMLVAFVDFSTAYDKVDRDKLWGCLHGTVRREWEILGLFGISVSGTSCQVRVGDMQSRVFEGCERLVKHRGEEDAGIYCLEEWGRKMEVKPKLT